MEITVLFVSPHLYLTNETWLNKIFCLLLTYISPFFSSFSFSKETWHRTSDRNPLIGLLLAFTVIESSRNCAY